MAWPRSAEIGAFNLQAIKLENQACHYAFGFVGLSKHLQQSPLAILRDCNLRLLQASFDRIQQARRALEEIGHHLVKVCCLNKNRE